MHLIDLLQQNNKSFISSKSGVNVSFNSPCLHFGQLLSFIHKSQKIFKHLSHFFEILFNILLHWAQKHKDILSISELLIRHISFIKSIYI